MWRWWSSPPVSTTASASRRASCSLQATRRPRRQERLRRSRRRAPPRHRPRRRLRATDEQDRPRCPASRRARSPSPPRPRRSSRSSGTGMTLRRSSWRRAMPSSSRSSSSGSSRTLESEPMQSGIPRSRTRATGRKPSPRFASVSGQTQMRRAGLREQGELVLVGVRAVDDRRLRAEAAGLAPGARSG